MRKYNKRALYETIMSKVAKQVKKALNEGHYDRDGGDYTMKINANAIVIGDPCYCLPDDIYYKVWGADDNDFSDGPIGKDVGLVHGTYDGDGRYDARSGSYCVDSGTLGIFNIDYCKDDVEDDDCVKVFNLGNGTHIIELSYENGDFYFTVDGEQIESIWTGPGDYEDEDEDEEEYWEEDEDEDEDY